MFFDKAKKDIYEQKLWQNVNILPDGFLHCKQISEDYLLRVVFSFQQQREN